MPMNPADLGAALKAAAEAPPNGDPLARWTAIATALIAHLTANMQVNPGIAVSTTGSPTAQTGSTTAPGTVS